MARFHHAGPPEVKRGLDWYIGYGQRHGGDGAEGRLVALHTFTSDRTSWEMHPRGHEVVICTAGQLTLVQELDGEERLAVLAAGEYAIDPPGVWRTADVETSAAAVFITAREGTEHRPR